MSVFYKWVNDDDKEHRDCVIHSETEVVLAVKAVIKDSNNTLPGALRVHFELKKNGFKVSHKRLVAIMRKNSFYHKFHRKYVKDTDSNQNLARAEDLVKGQYNSFKVNEAWCGDITYIHSHRRGLALFSFSSRSGRQDALLAGSFAQQWIPS